MALPSVASEGSHGGPGLSASTRFWRNTADARLTLMSPNYDADTTGMSVIPSQFDLIRNLLDATAARQRVTSQNIANVNTPGYKAREVNFEDQLARALARPGDSNGILDLAPEVRFQDGLVERLDGNNVDIDRELGRSQKNTLLHNTYVRILSTKINTLRSAISGR